MSSNALHVLIIAHPDDESMFFVPTLRALKNEAVWIVCLTTGDYEGLGKIRAKEMLRAGQLLNAEKVLVCDESSLKDHPTKRWDIAEVQDQIQTTLRTAMSSTANISSTSKSWSRLILITFDQYGVSGHINHIDTYLGVCSVARQGIFAVPGETSSTSKNENNIPVEVWSLVTERNMLAKYIPILSWLLLFLSFFRTMQTPHANFPDSKSTQIILHRLQEPRLNWKAMTTHQSQFVWYRRLFVVFSCYTYVNKLQRIPASGMDSKTHGD